MCRGPFCYWSGTRDHEVAYEHSGGFHIVVIWMAFTTDHTASKRVTRSTKLATDLEAGVRTRWGHKWVLLQFASAADIIVIIATI
jgi:hypothetical protein